MVRGESKTSDGHVARIPGSPGAEGPGSTRESQNTQLLGVRFRALLTDRGPQVHFHREVFKRSSKALP
jgi:hypothetical protein